MRLTAEEAKTIDDALVSLKRALKDELSQVPAAVRGDMKLDDPFLQSIGDNYLSANGVLSLLLDSGVVTGRCGAPCQVTCVNPAKVACGTDTFK